MIEYDECVYNKITETSTLRNYTAFEIEILNERIDEEGMLGGDQRPARHRREVTGRGISTFLRRRLLAGFRRFKRLSTAICPSSESGCLKNVRDGWSRERRGFSLRAP